MDEITVTFEVYIDGVEQSRVTGTRAAIRRMAEKLALAEDTFCIRTEDGTFCRCKEWRIL